MDHEPKPFFESDMKSDMDLTLPEKNPELAKQKLLKELEENGLRDNYIIPGVDEDIENAA